MASKCKNKKKYNFTYITKNIINGKIYLDGEWKFGRRKSNFPDVRKVFGKF